VRAASLGVPYVTGPIFVMTMKLVKKFKKKIGLGVYNDARIRIQDYRERILNWKTCPTNEYHRLIFRLLLP
jgi:hypothetical protein